MKQPKTPKTNVEFVTHLMEYSDHGAMTQLVILTAIEKYCEQVIQDEAAFLESMKGSLINGTAWVGTCKELKQKLDERYQSTTQAQKIS